MADLIQGSCQSPPGTVHRLPPGARCDHHAERYATTRLQGETDANGVTPLHDLCPECRDLFSASLVSTSMPVCDICNQPKADLQRWRDPEDGVAGPVYDACTSCREGTARFHRGITEADDALDPEEQAERELISTMGEAPPLLNDPQSRRAQARRQLVAPTGRLVKGGWVGVPVLRSVPSPDSADEQDE